MRKVMLVLTALAVLFACVNLTASPAKYDEVVAAMERMVKIMEDLAAEGGSAADAKAFAAALKKANVAQKELIPELKRLAEKFPELTQLMKDKQTPEELKPVMAKMEAMQPKMMPLMAKFGQFGTDPEVQKVQQEMMAVQQEMGSINKPKEEPKKEEPKEEAKEEAK